MEKFATIQEVQAYVKARWQGVEYVDHATGLHTDYCRYELKGATLADLGQRVGAPGTDEWFDWAWRTF